MSARPIVDTREAGRDSCADVANRAFDTLEPGDRFVLVADHDPRPLRYMFEAERPGELSWTPLEEGPDLWQVEVGRTASA